MCPHKYACKYTERRLSGSARGTQEDFIFCSENIWFWSWILFQSQNQFEFEIPQCIHIIFLLDTKLYLNGMWIKIQGRDRQSGANPNGSAGRLAKPLVSYGGTVACVIPNSCVHWLEATSQMHMTFGSSTGTKLEHWHTKNSLTYPQISLPDNQLMHSNNAELSLNTVLWLGGMTWYCLDLQVTHRRCRKSKFTC